VRFNVIDEISYFKGSFEFILGFFVFGINIILQTEQGEARVNHHTNRDMTMAAVMQASLIPTIDT
jgi:hypothetical protein